MSPLPGNNSSWLTVIILILQKVWLSLRSIISTWECRSCVTVSSPFSKEVRSQDFVYNFLIFKQWGPKKYPWRPASARMPLPVSMYTEPQTLLGRSSRAPGLGQTPLDSFLRATSDRGGPEALTWAKEKRRAREMDEEWGTCSHRRPAWLTLWDWS